MKLDKLFQSLLLTGAVVVLISTPARSEVNQGESSTGAVGESTFKDTLGVRNSKSPVLTSNNRKHRDFPSQVASSLQRAKSEKSNRKILQLNEISQVSQSAELLVQSPASSEVIQVTGVEANPTDNGVEVILQTTQGEQLQITNNSADNNFIADIPNAQLRLPSGDGFTFRSQNPIEGITEITVTNLDTNTIRVTVTGEAGLPAVDLFDSNEGLIFGFTPAATAMQPEAEQPTSETPQEEPVVQGDKPIELIVTGQQDNYRVPNATSATRTDTPLRDIPQSIQVVPQQVIRDQQATRLIEVLQNVPGVVQGGVSPRTYGNSFNIRGFNSSDQILVNGLPDPTNQNAGFGSNVERVEVLKGPASVLYGQGGLAGKVNLVTKRPLLEPFYEIEASAGSFNFYRGAIDLSGPLNTERTVLYRLNVSGQTTESLTDFYEQQRYLVAPVLSWQISDRSKLTLEADYSRTEGPFDLGIPAQGSVLPNPNGKIPRNRYIGEPNIDNSQQQVFRAGFDFEHRFSDNWQMRSVFRASFLQLDRDIVFSRGAGALQDDGRTLNRIFDNQDYKENIYNLDTYTVGNFTTGSIEHELVVGLNLFRYDTDTVGSTRSISPLDVFNPVYGATLTGASIPAYDVKDRIQQLGFYVQDQITLTEQLKVLLGGRFDISNKNYRDATGNFGPATGDFKQEEAFSPRVGIVYQPVQPISLYASYSSSFNQATSTFSPAESEPERGKQYEIGVKANLTERLSATLAFYDLTRSNLPTADPNNPLQTIQVGEQRSRGIEFDISGEILPGWNIIAGYALTEAEITKDNNLPVGNQLNNVPRNTLNLWTTYELQSGSLQGFGFGLGVFYFGERQGDLANTFVLPGYTRTDAAIFYKRDNFRAALNIRNLFDVDYFVSAQNRARVFPGDPFTVVGTVSWQF
ncbi:TonB-dependent siderophore receptor [Nodularia chucula]|uniref:TonB-dependent siderophore receptor n=1 Tax=Nodularia chucula TaxID=3093667 RepID=UPI0039C757BF